MWGVLPMSNLVCKQKKTTAPSKWLSFCPIIYVHYRQKEHGGSWLTRAMLKNDWWQKSDSVMMALTNAAWSPSHTPWGKCEGHEASTTHDHQWTPSPQHCQGWHMGLKQLCFLILKFSSSPLFSMWQIFVFPHSLAWESYKSHLCLPCLAIGCRQPYLAIKTNWD